jgi:hypothetical protein
VDNACSPLDRAQDEAEHALTRTVSRCDVTALAELPAYLELPIDVPGVHVAPLDLETVELALSPHTLRAVSHPK